MSERESACSQEPQSLVPYPWFAKARQAIRVCFALPVTPACMFACPLAGAMGCRGPGALSLWTDDAQLLAKRNLERVCLIVIQVVFMSVVVDVCAPRGKGQGRLLVRWRVLQQGSRCTLAPAALILALAVSLDLHTNLTLHLL